MTAPERHGATGPGLSGAAPAVERGDLDAERIYAALREQLCAALHGSGRTPHLIGVHSGGAWIAERLHADLALAAPMGWLSSAFHRDDYGERGLPAHPRPTRLDFDVAGADLIVVDDILFTGRTVRAALNELFDYGRPSRIELAVLLDRGGRELPIAAQYVGARHPLAAPDQFVLTQDTAGRLALRLEHAA